MRTTDKIFFRGLERYHTLIVSSVRKLTLRLRGLTIGRSVLPRCRFTWPHKVSIGDSCWIEEDVVFKHDGIWSHGKSILIGDRVFLGRYCEFNIRIGVKIGDGSAIASGCKFIDHDHGFTGTTIDETPGKDGMIVIEEYVWLGVNVVVLKGVTIGRGAVVGAGAVVTRSIAANEIWAGVPARKIGVRPGVVPALK